MSRTDIVDEAEAQASLELLREINTKAAIITTPIEKLDGKKLLDVMEHPVSLAQELMEEEEVCPECGHVHEHGEHHHHDHEEHEHHHDHDHECGCGHDHDHEEHEHHHHDHDHECGCGHDHHEHDHECGCGHHHHHADEVFNSIGFDTVKKYNEVELSDILNKLCNDDNVLRAKGFVDSGNEDWWYFDLVPGEFEIRLGKPIYTGQVCVIGKDLDENTIKELFLG